MDAAWKVYVQDRRFDDDQISNCFLKMKYETVGRFTFDFRAIDGDESYMVPGNTLRIFWGDLHKMDGVIQRADWDSTQFCYHVYGADIRGFLLDRVNTEPATVSSYTSDVQSQVMFTGCDFPSNIWTGAGESIGKYTFHYKIGIQNTIRIMGPEFRWITSTERGTVYDHVNGCLYDATKNWEPNALRGATLRFVSGACKNNVYNICGNSSNKVCLRMATQRCSDFSTTDTETIDYGGTVYGRCLADPGFESGTVPFLYATSTTWPYRDGDGNLITGEWRLVSPSTGRSGWASVVPFATEGTYSLFAEKDIYGNYNAAIVSQEFQVPTTRDIPYNFLFNMSARVDTDHHVKFVEIYNYCQMIIRVVPPDESPATLRFFSFGTIGWDQWKNTTIVATADQIIPAGSIVTVGIAPANYVWIDGVSGYLDGYGDLRGMVPGCSRIGDVYEIVFASMERIEPASLAPATLEKDSHIIRYNRVNSLSDHTTSMTIRGT